MPKQRWVPDTARFTGAVDELRDAYLDVLHEQTEAGLAGQGAVLERMRRFEKSAGATAARIAKRAKADYAPLQAESQRLARALADAQVHAAETMLTLQRIDELLPAPDRLFAPGQPHRHHYAELHRSAASAAAPRLVGRAAQPAHPDTGLDRTPANAAPPKSP